MSRVALILLAACSGKALTPDAAPSVDGPGIDSGGDVSQPDASATADADAEGGGLCGPPTFERADVALRLPGGGVMSCAGAPTDAGSVPPPTRTWVGKVSASDATSLSIDVIDTCEGDAGCPPGVLRVEVTAPGLDLTAFPRVWVRVQATFGHFRACQQALELTTAAPLDGSTPDGPAGQLLLAIGDGDGPFEDSPYAVDRVRLGCSSEKGCGPIAPDNYALTFSAADAPPLRVDMGGTAKWTVGGSSLRVHNLRSYQSIACDEYWNFAYYIVVNP